MKISFLFTKLEILTFHHNHPLPTNKTFARMASASNISSSSNGSSYKLSELRKLMAENNLAAYYVPSEDAHQVINTIKLFQFLILTIYTYPS